MLKKQTDQWRLGYWTNKYVLFDISVLSSISISKQDSSISQDSRVETDRLCRVIISYHDVCDTEMIYKLTRDVSLSRLHCMMYVMCLMGPTEIQTDLRDSRCAALDTRTRPWLACL